MKTGSQVPARVERARATVSVDGELVVYLFSADGTAHASIHIARDHWLVAVPSAHDDSTGLRIWVGPDDDEGRPYHAEDMRAALLPFTRP